MSGRSCKSWSQRQFRFVTTQQLLCMFFFAAATGSAQTVPQWRIEELTRIGDESRAETALNEIRDVTIGSDGRVFVLQWMSASVAVFDSTGRFVRTIGRRGGGPGELVSPAFLGWRADTLWVSDPPGRIELFSADGERLGSIRFAKPPGSTDGPVTVFADGTVRSGGITVPISLTLLGRVNSHVILRTTRGGAVRDTILHVPIRREDHVAVNGRHGFGPVYTQPLLADLASGQGIVVVQRAPPTGPGPVNLVITALSPAGDTMITRSHAFPAVPISERWKEGWLRKQTDLNHRDETPAAFERALRQAAHFDAYFPIADRLVTGDDGTVWIRRSPGDADVARWEVFDADLNRLAWIEAPIELQIHWATRDALWASTPNSLDVPTLIRYRIAR